MKGGKSPLGYTILEVLIVLAVSGVMFIIAANFISGKQQKSTFQTGANELASQIQDAITSITDGQYSDYPVRCSRDASGNINTTSGPGVQGGNEQCIFLGKFLNFNISGDDTVYKIFTVAGLRSVDVKGTPPVDLNAAQPTALSSLTQTKGIPSNLSVTGVKIHTSGGSVVDKRAFGFLQSLDSGSDNGAQQPPKFYYPNTLNTVTANQITMADIQAGNLLADGVRAVLCLSDGQSRAEINVGQSQSQFSVKVKMLGTASCA